MYYPILVEIEFIASKFEINDDIKYDIFICNLLLLYLLYKMSRYFLDRRYLKMYTSNEYFVYQEGFVKTLRNFKVLRLL